ncbi:hypothetical protein MLD38_024532 [Melastoma candidum]|uniref:Uncharacterized protein n=1 Tax=Melastoma candidum TaxID=119954 RepID=A0ACB9NSK6_9MYRT|nr:hypothetical protein MLD38_024532 [Melastoma candidum]
MYARILKGRNQRWDLMFQSAKRLLRPSFSENIPPRNFCCFSVGRRHYLQVSSIRGYVFQLSLRHGAPVGCNPGNSIRHHQGSFGQQLCAYSSGGDERNASENKHEPVKEGAEIDPEGSMWGRDRVVGGASCCDAHSRLGDQEQKEWLANEKLAIESKKRDSPFLSRHDRFKSEFLRRIIPWEKIAISWETFPYRIDESTKNVLVECAASHLRQNKFATSYGAGLSSSSGRILLQSDPGTELFRERLVKALAHGLQVPLLVVDSRIIAPYDSCDDYSSESDEENVEYTEEYSSESDVEDEIELSNEDGWTSSVEARSDESEDEMDMQATAEAALKKLAPFSLEEFEKQVSQECGGSSKSSKVDEANKFKRPFCKGDRIKYVGPSKSGEVDTRFGLGKIPTTGGPINAYTILRGRSLSIGQRGEVYEVAGDSIAVIMDDVGNSMNKGETDERSSEQPAKSPVYWVHVKDVEHDMDIQAAEFYIAMEALCQVMRSMEPLIVYFPDYSHWLYRAVPKSKRNDFMLKLQDIFEQLSVSTVLICGQNKSETGSKNKITMTLPNIGRVTKLPLSVKSLTEGLKSNKASDIQKLFSNIVCLYPPQDQDLLRTFHKQVEEDRKVIISRSNLIELCQVLEENELSCMELVHWKIDDVVLTKRKAEKVVGWAKNHYLASCAIPSVKGDRLYLPLESLGIAISRMKEQGTVTWKASVDLKNIAKDDFERNFIPAVVAPGDIGVKFDDVGALEDVKNALNELVILPMRRPELFSHGNLLRPCKGILLFGPPGTGKTLLAKALATEAGANFISITGSTLTSKWFGDAEKLTKALFSFASRLAPVIIFVDEVDSLLGARGGGFEHEATRRMRNEFMAAWDGLRSNDSERILILGATNRPFDLDDAVIRRLPRRIYVDLPDTENRRKILSIILGQENLQPGFELDQLANATNGYSGSDLKNLCIAAAYRPVQELLEAEKQGGNGNSPLRPLNLDDFVKSKSKVAPSVAYDAASMNELRKWNEQYGEGGSRRKSQFGF